jgi:thiol-disulfide isomerase/thioredoxin
MISIILAALVQVSALGAEQHDFEQAYQRSLTTRRPLVVLVGAGWCSACQKMKNSILPQVAETGGLKRVVLTYVDFDQQHQLASRLSRGNSVPQLIRFDQTPTGWKSRRLIGARKPREVYDFVNAGLVEQDKVNKVAATDQPRNHLRKSAPEKSVGSTPSGSEPGASGSVDATGARRSDVGSSPVEEAAGSSYWIVFLKQFLPKRQNR